MDYFNFASACAIFSVSCAIATVACALYVRHVNKKTVQLIKEIQESQESQITPEEIYKMRKSWKKVQSPYEPRKTPTG